MITVVNSKNHIPTNHDIYIGRGSPLGNPFTHLPVNITKAKYQVATRSESISKYKSYIIEQLKNNLWAKGYFDKIVNMAKDGDVNLLCYCKPLDCHGDILKQLIEKEINNES